MTPSEQVLLSLIRQSLFGTEEAYKPLSASPLKPCLKAVRGKPVQNGRQRSINSWRTMSATGKPRTNCISF